MNGKVTRLDAHISPARRTFGAGAFTTMVVMLGAAVETLERPCRSWWPLLGMGRRWANLASTHSVRGAGRDRVRPPRHPPL